MPKSVAVLGSTGSIGTNALDVISRLPQQLSVWGLSANTNWLKLAEQARAFRPKFLSMADEASNKKLTEVLPDMAKKVLPAGEFAELAAQQADVTLVAVVGAAGLAPSLAVARAGKRLALANKESLVMAGSLIMAAAQASGAEVVPVDSEHSALFQAIHAGRGCEVRKVVITASGGPFLNRSKAEFASVTVAEALSHPTWSMGRKITIDSATMVNKAFEVIEARWLFDLAPQKISVLVHPESIIHSMVEFADGSVLAQMSLPDMRLPIQYALTYPERLTSHVTALDLAELGTLTFRRPDTVKFPCLQIGFDVAREGGTLGAVFNAANEVAVAAFLDGRTSFTGVYNVIRSVIDKHTNSPADSIQAIFDADRWARSEALKCL